jgi:hypothetical protein
VEQGLGQVLEPGPDIEGEQLPLLVDRAEPGDFAVHQKRIRARHVRKRRPHVVQRRDEGLAVRGLEVGVDLGGVGLEVEFGGFQHLAILPALLAPALRRPQRFSSR